MTGPAFTGNLKFVAFQHLHAQVDKKIQHAHSERKTWVQAHFENVDPCFFNAWKLREENDGITCRSCSASKVDTDILSLANTLDLSYFDELDEKPCSECARVWCQFTSRMLHSYCQDNFKNFGNIHLKFRVKTQTQAKQLNGCILKKRIEFEFELNPYFYVVDEPEGKRVIYCTKLENVACASPHFNPEMLKYKLNFVA